MSTPSPLSASSTSLRPRRSNSLKARAMHMSFLERGGKSSRAAAVVTPEMALPERFRASSGNDEDDDGVGETDSPLSAQSIYGMMAATQSPASFPAAFQKESDSEGEDDGKRDEARRKKRPTSTHRLSHSMAAFPGRQTSSFGDWRSRKRLADAQKSSRASPGLASVRERGPLVDESGSLDVMSQSQVLARPSSNREEMSESPLQGEEAPVLDRKIQAMAEAELPQRRDPNASDLGHDVKSTTATVQHLGPSHTLPHVIADIFSFTEPEEVVAEYPCWYLQNVLLQGYMYITRRHICFYAYLQKRTNVVEKSGHIGKQGRHSYKYRRYYFVLKGDTFSYYRDASDPYFPLGMVDLRYAISAEVTSDEGKDTTDFTVTTSDRVFLYRADSPIAARSWVKALQKVIFRTHNEGDSIKISLPVQNVDEVERMPMIDFAETLKIRVVDNDETFAVDEYFFTFFGESGPEVLTVLQTLTAETQASKGRSEEVDPLPTQLLPTRGKTAVIPGENLRTQGNQTDAQGSDVSIHVASPSPSRSPQESAESLTTSSDVDRSSDNDDEVGAEMSASQMLTGDGVFGAPTLRVPQTSRTRLDELSQQRGSDSHDARISKLVRTSTEQTVKPERPSSRNDFDQDVQRRPSTDGGALGRGKLAAISVAKAVQSSSKRVGSYLGSSPTGYFGKLTEAVIGGTRHYDDTHIPAPNDRIRSSDTLSDLALRQQRFHGHFALPETEKLEATYFCYLHKNLPMYGKIYISARRFCFRSLIYGVRTKLVIPFKEIVNVETQRGFRLGYSGIVLVIHGHEELFFEFRTESARNDCAATILRKIEASQITESMLILTDQQRQEAEGAAAENETLQAARRGGPASKLVEHSAYVDEDTVPILSDDPIASLTDVKPPPPMLVTCLTIGSRGDVQPYIALCKGLMAQGHRARIASHAEFRGWVEGHGIEFAEVAGDPAELMRVCVENGMFTIPFFIEANSKFRSWLDGLLLTAWEACQGSDLIIESPSAMCGIHIAEALEVPYFRAFTMPWTRTRAYPHAFAVRNAKMGGAYNYMTYTLFDNVFWTWTEGQVNSWRTKTLNLQPTNLDKLQQNKVPFLYNFSPSVVPPPLDFSDWVKVTGYWFLNEGTNFKPPADLAAFIKKARDDNMKLVYIGFGSVTVNDSRKLTEQIVNAVVKADVRCILSKGWSDRFEKKDANLPDLVLPPCIHTIRAAPHDWLFTQIDAVVHHGGAGTTGASLRAGKPTIIKPFFGDQYFFATRVEDLGVGIHLSKATEHQLGKALWTAVHDDRMQTKARLLGEAIRSQDGVQTAIKAIYADLEYARSLIKRKKTNAGGPGPNSPRAKKHSKSAKSGDGRGENHDEEFNDDDDVYTLNDDTEENWTFVDATADDESAKSEQLPATTSSSAPGSIAQQQQKSRLTSSLRLGPTLLGRRA